MTAETLFSLASAAVLPGWALLVLVPRWKWTARLVGPVLIPALLSLLYLDLLAARWAILAGGFGSLATVRRLFDDPAVLLAGWVHYLVFDLFVGSWEVRDAQPSGGRAIVPCPDKVARFRKGPNGWQLENGEGWSRSR